MDSKFSSHVLYVVQHFMSVPDFSLNGYFTHFKQISKLSNIDKLIFIKHNPKYGIDYAANYGV